MPLTRALVVENARAGPFEILEHALAEAEQRGAGRRDADLAAEAEEQLLLQLLFEQQDLAADGRLRQVQLLPGARERARLRDRAKNLQLSQVHDTPPRTAAILSSARGVGQRPNSPTRSPSRQRTSETERARNAGFDAMREVYGETDRGIRDRVARRATRLQGPDSRRKSRCRRGADRPGPAPRLRGAGRRGCREPSGP